MAIWQTLWASLAPHITAGLIVAIALTLAATNFVKILATQWKPSVTTTAAHWRAFSATASVIVGGLSGGILWWAAHAHWWVVPVVAFGSGPIWRIASALAPESIKRAIETATDRKFRQGG